MGIAPKAFGVNLRKELATRSDDTFPFTFGGLYPLLKSLERRRLVTSRWLKPKTMRERRQYAITATGRAELRIRKQKWRQFSRAMNRILGE